MQLASTDSGEGVIEVKTQRELQGAMPVNERQDVIDVETQHELQGARQVKIGERP